MNNIHLLAQKMQTQQENTLSFELTIYMFSLFSLKICDQNLSNKMAGTCM